MHRHPRKLAAAMAASAMLDTMGIDLDAGIIDVDTNATISQNAA